MSGNWITANLQAAIDFFNAMMEFLYDILTINPVTYRDGAIWQVAGTIYDALLGTAISLGVIFICMGFIENAGEFIQHRNAGAFLWTFMKMMFMSGILIYGRYLMILVFSIGKEFVDKVVLENGINVFSAATWISIPQSIYSATDGLSMSSGIVFWVVTLLAALIIMVSCFSIMLTVYGRMLKIYMHIAIAPLPLACYTSKVTMPHFMAFVRSFIGVVLEGLVIIVACLIFSAFANNFDIHNPLGEDTGHDSAWNKEDLTDEEKEDLADSTNQEWEPGHVTENVGVDEVLTGVDVQDALENIRDRKEAQAENAELMWKYLGEMIFMFLMLAGTIKGADETVRKMLGV